MNKAQTDIRATSYNAATANPNGYTGTIDDAIAQIRAEPDEVRAYWPLNMSRERHELLGFLGVFKPEHKLYGIQEELLPFDDEGVVYEEDDTVVYGAPEAPVEPGKYSLERALRDWPENFKQ